MVEGKQILGSWRFYYALLVVLAITPTSSFLSRDHTNNPHDATLRLPWVQGNLAGLDLPFIFVPTTHAKLKQRKWRQKSLPSKVKVKTHILLILCANIWCHQDVQCGLKQTAEMHTNWKKKSFLMWKIPFCEGCFAICLWRSGSVVRCPLSTESVLRMAVGRCGVAAEGLEQTWEMSWVLDLGEIQQQQELAAAPLHRVMCYLWNFQLSNAVCQRPCVVYQHPHPLILERRLNFSMAPMKGHWPEVLVSAVSSAGIWLVTFVLC